jgi:hypothetical protein
MNSPAQRLARSVAQYAVDVHGRTPRRVQIVFDFGEDRSETMTIPAEILLIATPDRSKNNQDG